LFYLLFVSGRSPLYRFLPRSGPLALVSVFGPYLWTVVVLILVGAYRQRLIRLCPLLPAIAHPVFTRRQAMQRVDLDASSGAQRFSVMSWNILFRNRRSDAMLRFLRAGPADVVALQELTADHVDVICADPAMKLHYPHRVVWGYGIGSGMGLLSRFPVLEHGRIEIPPVLWARLDLGTGRTIVLASAHPTFGRPHMVKEEPKPERSWIKQLTGLFDTRFFWYDPKYRDDGIARVRALVEPLLEQGETLLLVGDFNVTERERAYYELSAGLQDVYLAVGVGGGSTWRPERLIRWPLPLLRIDYMLSSPGIRPLRMWVDRTPRGSDHCSIHAIFELK
jgi:vancomycin resistance protein VanJ